jgi:putative tricarboxylic transport membrane protein
MLLVDTPHLFWFIVGNLTLANLCLLVFGLSGIRVFARIVECPKAVLIPLIVVVSCVGAYAIQNNPSHISWMLGFGIAGYLLRKYGFQVGPIILGVILGPMIDSNYRRAMIAAREDVGVFLMEFLVHPVSLVLSLALVALLVAQTPVFARRRARAS